MKASALSNPPLQSAAVLLAENLIGVLLRNVLGSSPILWSFGNQAPAPRHGEGRERGRRRIDRRRIDPKVVAFARGDNVWEFH